MTAAIYCRLSKEDEEKTQESESIQNQKSLLLRYVLDRGWDLYDIYCDEDYSGADRTRPGFCRLIKEAEEGRFQIILVKTQSRFTRDMEIVETYIHGKFLQWGIRFIAVVDNADSEVKGNKKARQINGLINEWYLEDLSENIRAVLDFKRKSGQYVGGFPLYGYQKSPGDRHQLIADPDAARVVKRIFELCLSGMGKGQIARLLNVEGVPNPTRYKELKGLPYVNGGKKGGEGLWSRATVGRILKEPMYTGDLVQGRRKKASYKSKKLLPVPREDWIVTPGAHEPIVDRSVFEAANRYLKERAKSTGSGEAHPLAGKVKCLGCGGAMHKISNSYRGKSRHYLRCAASAADKSRCSGHFIRLDLLEEEILKRICRYMREYWDEAAVKKLITEKNFMKEKKEQKKEILALSAEAEQYGKALRDLYLDKSRGILEEEEFLEWNKNYLAEKKRIVQRIEALQKEEELNKSPAALEGKIKSLLAPQKLTRELASALIDRVEIGEYQKETGEQEIKIHWLI